MTEDAGIWSVEARRRWLAIAPENRTRILRNVWCSSCAKTTVIAGYTGRAEGACLILDGICGRCGQKVTRVLEESENLS